MGTIETTFASKEDAARVAAGWLCISLFCEQMGCTEVRESEGKWVPVFTRDHWKSYYGPLPSFDAESTKNILECKREFVEWAVGQLVADGVVTNGESFDRFHGIVRGSVAPIGDEPDYERGQALGKEWATSAPAKYLKRLRRARDAARIENEWETFFSQEGDGNTYCAGEIFHHVIMGGDEVHIRPDRDESFGFWESLGVPTEDQVEADFVRGFSDGATR